MSDITARVEDQTLVVSGATEAPVTSPAEAIVGKVVGGQFRVTKFLGAGANGAVYKAEQMFLDRPVALKTIHQSTAWDKEHLLRFQQEARALAKLNHPNLIAVHQFGVDDDGSPFLVMDYENGMTLDKLLRIGRLDSKDVLEIGIQAAAALQHAHEQDILHRDIKPSNLFVNRAADGSWKVKVIDFGLVKDFSQVGLTHTGDILGTPIYMSPEALEGHFSDPRSDIYSLGAVLYESLMLVTPYMAHSAVELIHKQKTESPTDMKDAGVWPAARRVINRAICPNRDRRFQTMKDFREAMEEALKNPADAPWRTGLFQINRFLFHADSSSMSPLPMRTVAFATMIFMIGFMLWAFWLSNQLWDQHDRLRMGIHSSQRWKQVEHNEKWYQSMTDAQNEEDDSNIEWARRYYESALRHARETEPNHRNERILESARALANIYGRQKNDAALARVMAEIESVEKTQEIVP